MPGWRKPDAADRWLLHVDAFAVDIRRGKDQRRCRADRCNLVALGRLVLAKLEHLVACHLRVVRREVSRRLHPRSGASSVFQLASIGRWQPPHARGPRKVAGKACQVSGSLCARSSIGRDAGAEGWNFPSSRAISLPISFARAALALKLGRTRRSTAVLDQADFPFERSGIDDRALDQRAVAEPLSSRSIRSAAHRRHCAASARLLPLGGAAGPDVSSVRICVRRAVAILASDLDCVGDLAVDEAGAMAESCAKWQSAHCRPFSAWMSIMWTVLPGLVADLDEFAFAVLAPLLADRRDRRCCRQHRAGCLRGPV